MAQLLLMLLASSAAARTHYVAPGGDDEAPGTAAEPWRTIGRAAQSATAGDVVMIAGGTYREYLRIATSEGTGAAPIMFQAELGEQVVIDATGFPQGVKIGASNVILDGLEVANADGDGIVVLGGHSAVTLRNCRVHDNGGSGIRAIRAGALVFERCVVYANGSGGIEAIGRGASLAVDGATIWGNAGDGIVSHAAEATVENAIIAENGGWGIDAAGELTLAIAYSDLWANGAGDVADPAAVAIGPSTLAVDPWLHDPGNGDFRLAGNSPAVGAGRGGRDLGFPFSVYAPPRVEQPDAEGFIAGTARGWNLDDPDVLLQTIYGTAQDATGRITANTPLALSLDKGVAFAIDVPANTALAALRLKLHNVKPEVGLRVRVYDVTHRGMLAGTSRPSRVEPGGGANVTIFDRTYHSPAAVPSHREPVVSASIPYTDLVVHLGPLEVLAGEYLFVLDNVGPSNTLGSLIVGDAAESAHMGERAGGRPLRGGVRVATGDAPGTLRFFRLETTTDSIYTFEPRTPALQLTTTIVNHPPAVDAGEDQLLVLPEQTAQLAATVTDDGHPNPPGRIALTWTQQSGPGTATFADPTAARTTVTFSAFGTYVLRLTADDSALRAHDEVTIRWLEVLPPNAPPVVDAGPDQTVVLPRPAMLDGRVSDDGAPDPPRAVTATWSVVEGPGEVTFGDPQAVRTAARFSVAGTYVLRLTASDGQDSAADDLTVTVHPFGRYEGYGAGATGGAGGRVVTVTTLADGGPGSFRAAVDGLDGTPTIIQFAVGGEIHVGGEIRIAAGNVTVMGSSAPEPGITLNAAGSDRGLGIKASNVIVENLRIRNAERENIVLWGGRDIVIDHCSLTWSGDGALDINGSGFEQGVNHVTISRTLFAGAVEVSRSRGHRISWHYNLFTHNNRRQPKIFIAGPDYDFICNYVREWSNTAVNIQDSAGINLINNFFGPPFPGEQWERACYLSGATDPAAVYTAGNGHAPDVPGRDARGRYDVNQVGRAPRRLQREAPPVAVTIIPAADVPANVLADVGAMPRDAEDEAFIDTYAGPGRVGGGGPP